ncbi:ribonuclease P protein component [Salinarimonas soli]|uniref:Ribonuclease P protein component n=1 Tax=Salinarimonas soli TaxID=1638099 RepID=A0A5B2VIH4_9HYPH|nr:ribonuclease P protein component [Salinarimonas soli]KAA2238310.1 ribonuclease P protein component [Salinarimonas soli]
MRDPSSRAPSVGRLTKRPDFLAAASGRRFHTERMTVQGRVRTGADAVGLRVGLTVTRKVGHATERNRIKRRLREAVKQALAAFADRPMDLVVIARRPALAADYTVLVDDLARALHVTSKPRAPAPAAPRPPTASHHGTPHA